MNEIPDKFFGEGHCPLVEDGCVVNWGGCRTYPCEHLVGIRISTEGGTVFYSVASEQFLDYGFSTEEEESIDSGAFYWVCDQHW